MRRLFLVSLAAMLALWIAAPVDAQTEWTHRGRDAERNSVSAGMPPAIGTARFIASAPDYTLVGQSAPVVASGKVFVHAIKEVPDGDDTKWVRAVLAFGESDGQLVWDRVVGDQLTFDSRVSPTVDLVRGHVLIGAGDAVTALDIDTGDIAWQTTVSPMPIVNSTICIVGTRAMVADYTGFGTWATVYCLNLDADHPTLAAGDIEWTGSLMGSNGSEAALVPGSPDSIVVPDSGGYLRQFFLDGTPGWVFATPYAGTVWPPPSGSTGAFQAGCTVVDGRVYAATYNYYGAEDNSTLYCVNASTGVEIWNTPCERSSSTPIVTDSLVILSGGLTGFGSVPKVEAFRRSDGVKLWQWTDGGCWTLFPVLVGDTLYVGKYTSAGFGPCTDLYALDITKTPQDEGFEVGHTVDCGSSPAYANGNIYTLGAAGLYAFGPPVGAASVTAWESLATHGAAGEVSLMLTPGVVESRATGIRRLRVTVDSVLDPATVDSGALVISGQSGGAVSTAGADVTLTGGDTVLTMTLAAPLADGDRYDISVAATVRTADGRVVFGNASVTAGALAGDVNGSGGVTAADVLAVRASAGQGGPDVHTDVNVSGSVTGADMLSVRGRLGHALP